MSAPINETQRLSEQSTHRNTQRLEEKAYQYALEALNYYSQDEVLSIASSYTELPADTIEAVKNGILTAVLETKDKKKIIQLVNAGQLDNALTFAESIQKPWKQKALHLVALYFLEVHAYKTVEGIIEKLGRSFYAAQIKIRLEAATQGILSEK